MDSRTPLAPPSPAPALCVLGEALIDCVEQSDGSLVPLQGGSPFNLARAAARAGARVGYLPPFSSDRFGQRLRQTAEQDGVQVCSPDSACPTSLAMVTVQDGQPSYSFYREGVADRDWQPDALIERLRAGPAGVLHTGSLAIMPPDDGRVLEVVQAARALGWTISLDINLRPRVARDLEAYRASVWTLIRAADWVKASEEDWTLLTGGVLSPDRPEPALQALQELGVRHVALTFGAQGACLQVDAARAQAAAPTVDVVDTVGAGDTFWGWCLAAWMRHGPAAAGQVHTTLQHALRAAAINCSRRGCQPPWAHELG
ncbi:MAG: carbohydrate kinase [Caldimonas sp.]|uniref:PfkB family carbohydrate kinase n=1 Tax=Caldimonas manganoxidans TaxID=196015 RepID=UPI0004757285|nr:PfkB family carbohydrate kinase [Caldimonas manganoxidans]GIX23440.1 MAG: carbohydrate kinase [Caldimonas sp.]